MPRLALPGVDLFYRLSGTGPPLLFLHGAGGHSLSWYQQVPRFSSAFCCMTPDQPGFGLSHATGPEVEYADVLTQVLDDFDWEQVALVAHSMGGWAALRFAIANPTRVWALVLASSWAGLQLPEVLTILADREAELAAQQRRWRRGDPGSHLPGAGARMRREQPELHWLAAGISATNRGAGRRTWMRDGSARLLMPETPPEAVRDWRIPTLCVSGEEDVLVPPEAIDHVARALGETRVSRIPEAGHAVFLERAFEFNEIVLAFLRDAAVEAGRSVDAP